MRAEELIGLDVVLMPKTQHARVRVKEYGNVYTITEMSTGIGKRFHVISKTNNYERWVRVNNDKHFELKLKEAK